MKKFRSAVFLVSLTALLSACGGGGGSNINPNPTYTVTYDGNGNTGGSIPTDATNYEPGQTVTVIGNTSNLMKSGYTFAGWNTQADGNGTTYTQAQTFVMGSANVTLYAKWTANPTYTVTYNGNGNTGGSAPTDTTHYEQGQTVTVSGNTGNLIKNGYSFAGWNTQADGYGSIYTQAETFVMGTANVILYAKWTYSGPACGNGIREGSEQCDDGNIINLDGCNSVCKFEQNHRMNSFQIQSGTDSYCINNAFGQAMPPEAKDYYLQKAFNSGISDGTLSMILVMAGLDDLSGTDDAAVNVGMINGTPVTNGSAQYDGTDDLDWWYNANPLSLDENRSPTSLLNGTISEKNLTAGPGRFTLSVPLLQKLEMTEARLSAVSGAASLPLASNGDAPGHLASENLDPTLVSYATSGSGKVCGSMTASSLAAAPIPEVFVIYACYPTYSASNSMLDLLVGGCIDAFNNTLVTPIQPDRIDPEAPQVGSGGPYTLKANDVDRKVITCTDKDKVPVDLAACLNAVAYSSYFTFTTNRVIVK